MKRNLMAMLVLAAGGLFGQYRDGYGQPAEPGYAGGDARYDRDVDYADSYDVRTAPPPPRYAQGFGRPPMPGPGFLWVDGYWNWIGGNYAWVGGYWTQPPFAGGYWVAPRFSVGRFFLGYWGGGRSG